MASENRYPLILYQETMRPLKIPAFLILILFAGLCVAVFTGLLQKAGVAVAPLTDVLIVLATFAALVLWLIVVILPRASYVACKPDFLLLRIGLFRLVVSYARVRTARTVRHAQIHDPAGEPLTRRAMAVRMALRQCVALELSSYPKAFFLLRALAHPFLFLGREPGFLFAVRDWMGLGRELDEARAAWLGRRKDSTKPRRLVEML
jgi:hypothetical protein